MLRALGSTEVGVEEIQERVLRFICDDFDSPLQDLIQKNGVLILKSIYKSAKC